MAAGSTKPGWTFLTNHAHVLVRLADKPDVRGRDNVTRVGITERAARAIVSDLVADGYVTRTREDRRNHYRIHPGARSSTTTRWANSSSHSAASGPRSAPAAPARPGRPPGSTPTRVRPTTQTRRP